MSMIFTKTIINVISFSSTYNMHMYYPRELKPVYNISFFYQNF